MWVLQTESIELKQDAWYDFNKTGVSNFYKFMAVLKSEIYTNDFFLPKNFQAKV